MNTGNCFGGNRGARNTKKARPEIPIAPCECVVFSKATAE